MSGYQPKTGKPCSCKPGVQRDNCPNCEGTGMVIDFAAIRARRAALEEDVEPRKPDLETESRASFDHEQAERLEREPGGHSGNW